MGFFYRCENAANARNKRIFWQIGARASATQSVTFARPNKGAQIHPIIATKRFNLGLATRSKRLPVCVNPLRGSAHGLPCFGAKDSKISFAPKHGVAKKLF